MAQILDILEIEKNRSEENRGVIHLYVEGSFLRAYEWSAWLSHRFLKTFKVTNKNLKSIEGPVCFIGFPLTSLEKYAPSDDAVVRVGEKAYDLNLPTMDVPDDMTLEMMQADYNAWRNSLSVTESQSRRKEDICGSDTKQKYDDGCRKPLSMTAIMQQILSFPIENKTPMQCMSFLADVKQQLVELI